MRAINARRYKFGYGFRVGTSEYRITRYSLRGLGPNGDELECRTVPGLNAGGGRDTSTHVEAELCGEEAGNTGNGDGDFI